MNTLRLLGLLAIALLAVASLWFQGDGPRVIAPEQTDRHRVDLRLSDFTAVYMGADGTPEYELRGVALDHFADDETTELTAPHLTFHRPDAAPWDVYSGHGFINAAGDLVVLSQGVKMVQQQESGVLALTTERMRVQPEIDYAETESPVTLSSPQGVIDAVGMQAYLAEERLVLLSEVRGHYEPPHP